MMNFRNWRTYCDHSHFPLHSWTCTFLAAVKLGIQALLLCTAFFFCLGFSPVKNIYAMLLKRSLHDKYFNNIFRMLQFNCSKIKIIIFFRNTSLLNCFYTFKCFWNFITINNIFSVTNFHILIYVIILFFLFVKLLILAHFYGTFIYFFSNSSNIFKIYIVIFITFPFLRYFTSLMSLLETYEGQKHMLPVILPFHS